MEDSIDGLDVADWTSIVIPTFNRAKSLRRTLAAIPPAFEVIVVDDGSSDATASFLKECPLPRLRYVRQSNRGPAAARNRGIREASGRIIAFTNDDCVPTASWPGPLAKRLEIDPNLAGVGGRVLPWQNGLLSRYYTFHRILEPPASCSYLVTANCAYRRAVLMDVGGFDEHVRQAGGEDPGLSMKVRAMGHALAFEPDALVLHDYREGLRDFVRTFNRYGKGCAYVMGQ